MASKIPVIRNTRFSYFIPQFAIMLLLILIVGMFNYTYAIILGICLYFILSMYLKIIIPKWHRKGVFALKKGAIEAAIIAFDRSYAYFKKNAWIDKYRAFTLLSTSQFSYTEMALMNIIYCFEKMGNTTKAKQYHKKLQVEFPGNKYSGLSGK